MFTRTPKTDADSLAVELINARTQYDAVKNDVLDRAAARRGTINDTILDLKAEDEALAEVQAEAQR